MKLDDMIIVSVDDHLVEPPDMFKNHLTAAQLAKAPKMESLNGVEFWLFEDKKLPNIGLNAVAGRAPEEYGCEPTSLKHMRKGCYDVDARIDDMNANGILGSICFGSFVGFDGDLFLNAKDKDNAYTMIQAYNDWHIDEWCGAHPGRFIPIAITPMWDPNLMAAEIKRVKEKGCHTISFTDNPAIKGLPSIHDDFWEPMWKACSDYDMTLSCHIGSGNAPTHPSMDSPIEVWTMTFPMAIAVGAADWLHAKALRKYPNLKVALSEGGIGWVPYLLERADYVNGQHHAWTRSDFGDTKPSDIFRKHFYTCFIDDQFGLKNLDQMEEDKVMYECDYPHSDSQWPKAPEKLYESLDDLTDEQINKITHLNAMHAYNYKPFDVFKPEECTVGALRAKAKHVDLTPISIGANPLGDINKPVTSGDIMKMFMPEDAA